MRRCNNFIMAALVSAIRHMRQLERGCSLPCQSEGLSSYLELSSLTLGKQARMKSKPGSSKRQLQERNFEIVVNHINISEDQLPQVSRQSVAALKDVFGHKIKKYSGTFHHKTVNNHVHFLVMSEAPKTESAVKARIAVAMAPIFGTEIGYVEVRMFNEVKADAELALSLKGLGDYRSLYLRITAQRSLSTGLALSLKGLGDYRSLYLRITAQRSLSKGQWSSCLMESGTSCLETPGRVLDDKAQCKWQWRPSRQRLPSCSAKPMRICSLC